MAWLGLVLPLMTGLTEILVAGTKPRRLILILLPWFGIALGFSILTTFLSKNGKTTDAITHLTEALKIKPDFPEAHLNMGNVLVKLGKTQEAVAQYMETLTIDPS